MPERFDCIVLGAGMAGVTAARELKAAGKKVLLLEATAGIGGRMRSKSDFVLQDDGSGARAGFPVEEGADWIHVADEDPYDLFWKEIERYGFTADPFPKKDHNRVAFPDWGTPITAGDTIFYSESIRKMAASSSGLFGRI